MNTKDIKEAQRILDESLLRDAIRGDYLPKGSGIEDLTNSIREKMSNDGNLRRYGPDGSLDTEMYY